VGLRESKKLRTRQDIADKAMQLFVQRGFDRVTVAEVAEAAGVSQKTVFNYFPTKEDLFFDEVPAREAAIVEAIRGRGPGESVVSALRRLQAGECRRLCSPAFAVFARIIEESPALQAKELAVMARFTEVLAEAIRSELGAHELDAKIAANVLVSVHWQLFRNARVQALAGRHGPAAVRRLRSDLERAYRLLEQGLGELERSAEAVIQPQARAPG
jgi:AcrR family transcriptional regulator